MQEFKIYPILGLKSNLPHNDPSLFIQHGDGFATHCVDGINIDFTRKQYATSKSHGQVQWSNSAITDAAKCLGLFYFDDGATNAQWRFDGTSSGGRVYKYDSSRDPVRISDVVGHAGAVEFANDNLDLYSIIQMGTYMIFSDHGEHTPYKASTTDTALTKLILSGTEYKFRYLELFQNKIIGAYSDQTNGDIEIRWTDTLPVWATLDFPAANQLYSPHDDSISGIKNMGRNACYIYGKNSINRIDYYPGYSSPFAITNIVADQGCETHWSIVNVGGLHYMYNTHYGFCAFDGTANFPAGGKPISDIINDIVGTINQDYAGHIVGTFIPVTQEVAWAVPLYGSSVPSHIMFYNTRTGHWRIKDFPAWYVDYWKISSDVIWTDLGALGYTTWDDIGPLRWADIVSTLPYMVTGNTDGHTYYNGSEGNAGSNFDGYRVEPIMDFGRPEDRDLLLEIWFGIADAGSYSIYCSYRGGDTEAEVENSSWTTLPEVSCDSPSNAITRCAETNRLHQIKWGTDSANEPFSVNTIQFRYVPQGRY